MAPQLGVVGMMCMLLTIAAGALPFNMTSNELLVWNVSYITVAPLGIPQQVFFISIPNNSSRSAMSS